MNNVMDRPIKPVKPVKKEIKFRIHIEPGMSLQQVIEEVPFMYDRSKLRFDYIVDDYDSAMTFFEGYRMETDEEFELDIQRYEDQLETYKQEMESWNTWCLAHQDEIVEYKEMQRQRKNEEKKKMIQELLDKIHELESEVE